jgi:hypothetical protein
LRTGQPVEELAQLTEGNGKEDVELVRQLVVDRPRGSAVLCTDGDVLTEPVVAMSDEYWMDLGPAPSQEKASISQLGVDGDGQSALRTFLHLAAQPSSAVPLRRSSDGRDRSECF